MNETYDIVLIYPKTGMDMGSTVAPPHSLLAISAPAYKSGYRIKIIDMRTTSNWKEIIKNSTSSDTICFGVTAMTGTQIYFALQAAEFIRKVNANVPIIWGGPHPTILPEQTLKHPLVDIVVIGEADFSFLELVEALQKKESLWKVEGIGYKNGKEIVITPHRLLPNVEDLLPTPWDLINVEDYIHTDFYIKKGQRTLDIGQTSRGCPYNCGFCSSASIRERKWRAMSPEKSLEMLLEPVKRFNLTGIWIRDDEFYIDRNRVVKICEGLIKEAKDIRWYTSGTRVNNFNKLSEEDIKLIKKSGADTLKFGAESGNNRILKLINKGITVEEIIKANYKAKQYGIIPAYALMIGFPTETFEEINNTIDLGYRLQDIYSSAQLETISTYTALPGTPMYSLAIEHGLVPPDNLEGWINWVLDDYDIEGKKIPWYNYKQRIAIGNISYLSILANAMHNLAGSVRDRRIRWLFKTFNFITRPYFKYRLKHKLYYNIPEMIMARFIRKKLLYTSKKTIR